MDLSIWMAIDMVIDSMRAVWLYCILSAYWNVLSLPLNASIYWSLGMPEKVVNWYSIYRRVAHWLWAVGCHKLPQTSVSLKTYTRAKQLRSRVKSSLIQDSISWYLGEVQEELWKSRKSGCRMGQLPLWTLLLDTSLDAQGPNNYYNTVWLRILSNYLHLSKGAAKGTGKRNRITFLFPLKTFVNQ